VPRKFNRSSFVYQSPGNFRKSVEVCKRAIEIDPNFPPAHVNLAWTYLALENYAEAERTVRQAAERKLVVPDLLTLPYFPAFHKGDRAGMERAAAQARNSPGRGRLDHQYRGVCSGLRGSLATSKDHDPAGKGPGGAVPSDRKGCYV
jgi:tetratricopeptide (TPR) repeat protein